MSIKDKLEIGLKPDAPYRKANLPESQRDRAVDAPRKTSRARPTNTRRRTTTTATHRRTRTKAR
ncbi:MAG TPA: hypothetical protein VHD57_13230 [Vicinamibacterales bacterium]|jgi:hypothetical protein|nr:hypothetical protein [Vicinamibacterales bacterium]